MLAKRRTSRPVFKCHQPATWLVGTWRSDKAKTIRRWEYGAPAPDARCRLFVESKLGKSINRFSKERWYHSFEESRFSMPYRIVWQNFNSAFVVYADRRAETGELIIFLSRTTYYVQKAGYVEFFTKDRHA